MKFSDEFRDAELARVLSQQIAAEAAGRHWKIMEVCGGHTHTIFKYGIGDLLPGNVELVQDQGARSACFPWDGWTMVLLWRISRRLSSPASAI